MPTESYSAPKSEHPHDLLSASFYKNGLEELSEGLTIEELKSKVKSNLAVLEQNLGERASGLANQMDDISINKDMKTEDFINVAANRLSDFMRGHFTPSALEDIERESIIKNEENRSVNELVYYSIFPGRSEISLNLHNAVSMTLGEKLALFRSGLQELAQRISNDNELQSVDTIRAISWIVEAHPKILEKLGFTIDSKTTAHISKKELIKNFG